MKRKKYYTFILLIALFNFCLIKKVDATEVLTIKTSKFDFRIKAVHNNYVFWTKSPEVYIRYLDDQWLYSIEPALFFSNQPSYHKIVRDDILDHIQFTEEQFNIIKLLMYYGYGYVDSIHDHRDDLWYIVTQMAIWKTIEPEWEFNYIDISNEIILKDKFIKEELELFEMINKHNNSNYNESYTILNGQKFVFENSYQYSSKENKDLIIKNNNNQLTFEATKVGNYEIELYKEYDNFKDNIILYTHVQKDLIAPGKLNTSIVKINLKVKSASITLNNIDEETKKGIEGSTFIIYDIENNIVSEINTNEDGYAFDIIKKYGSYYLVEQEMNEKYMNNSKKHYFEINENNLNHSITIYSKLKDENKTFIDEESLINKDIVIDNIEVKVPVTGLNIIRPFDYNIYIISNISFNVKKEKRKV